jgi:hypothetical protein
MLLFDGLQVTKAAFGAINVYLIVRMFIAILAAR